MYLWVFFLEFGLKKKSRFLSYIIELAAPAVPGSLQKGGDWTGTTFIDLMCGFSSKYMSQFYFPAENVILGLLIECLPNMSIPIFTLQHYINQGRWHILTMSVLGRWRQKDEEFKVIVCYIVSSRPA